MRCGMKGGNSGRRPFSPAPIKVADVTAIVASDAVA